MRLAKRAQGASYLFRMDNAPGAESTPQNKGGTVHRSRKVGIRTAMILGVLSMFLVSCAETRPATTQFTVRATTIQRADIDADGNGTLSQGDQSVFSTTITRDGRDFGTGNALCITTRFVSEQDSTRQCYVSFRFPEGHISSVAILDAAEQVRYEQSITGGTDAYRDIGGEVLVELLEPTVVDLTFSIIHLT
jgi:hypothetical protein